MVTLPLQGFSLNNVNQLHCCLLLCKQTLHLSQYNELSPEQGIYLHSEWPQETADKGLAAVFEMKVINSIVVY